MDIREYLEIVAVVDDTTHDNPVYISKYDRSYITHIGMESEIEFLASREITQALTHGVGYSPKDGKWYGWSHRAIYGFEIGSTCEKGDCHYTAATPEELIESHVKFFENPAKAQECQILEDRSGIRILPAPLKIPIAGSLEEGVEAIEDDDVMEDLPLVDIYGGQFWIIKCGRGEWTAETLDDAKQMAIDFNKGVS